MSVGANTGGRRVSHVGGAQPVSRMGGAHSDEHISIGCCVYIYRHIRQIFRLLPPLYQKDNDFSNSKLDYSQNQLILQLIIVKAYLLVK